MNKRILFIGHDASRTGAPLLLLQFLRWLRDNTELQFDILLRSGGALIGEYQRLAPTRILHGDIVEAASRTLKYRLRRKLKLLPSLQVTLGNLYPKERYSLVYSNTVTNVELVEEFSRLGHRIICHVHELGLVISGFGIAQALQATVQNVQKFIAASRCVADHLVSTVGVPESLISVVHEFPVAPPRLDESRPMQRAALREKLGVNGTAAIVVMCGTTDWRKGVDLFVQLAIQLRKKFADPRDIHLLWVGGSKESSQLQHDVTRSGVADICSFIGETYDVAGFLSGSDIFALTSREDPFPVAMLEAAIAGLPIVCFEGSGGAPEFISYGNGIVVPYLDVAAMADACESLILDPSRRWELGERARKAVRENFLLEHQGPKLLSEMMVVIDGGIGSCEFSK